MTTKYRRTQLQRDAERQRARDVKAELKRVKKEIAQDIMEFSDELSKYLHQLSLESPEGSFQQAQLSLAAQAIENSRDEITKLRSKLYDHDRS